MLKRFSLIVLLIVCGAAPTSRPSFSSIPANNALLGNPSNATTDTRNKDNYLAIKKYFVLSYNSAKGEPNWVSWVLTKDDLGDAPRKRIFDTDTSLPDTIRKVSTKEYVKSGFDRGHMCPHSDRAANEDESYSTFIMSNIVPQAPNLNRKCWEALEEYGRDLASAGNHVYIISGPAGQGGVGSNGAASTIGNNIAVPAQCFKILVIVPEAGGIDDLRKINKATRVIAVMMPNDDSKCDWEWAQYRVSVADIEKATKLKFFTRLSSDIAAVLKANADDKPVPNVVPRVYGE